MLYFVLPPFWAQNIQQHALKEGIGRAGEKRSGEARNRCVATA
jgi:hypothetical protein